MANSDRKLPWGKVFALLPVGERDTEFVELGVAWMNQDKDGNDYISLDLKVEPVQWANPRCPRKLQIQKMKQRREGNRQ